ncbi:MFS transporter [Pseudoalteromonas distincta]|uniref:Sugar porter family MFS transporter n=1 Tax=Pseudoalteromonas distincta TaxID=77608 RepID=A0ABT9GIV7_9GAMM|nr:MULTISPECIES: sugar porter family MFS transporter [Pseudoalteromonas distincta group]KAA1161278.1 sugar porter family MFS transporter [Pseudoalteromonas distincta]KHM51137.1 MFS transporter [Pseudoalteromonas elyakovii]KID34413.1 MFS transporter [Pseudoalteromonas distincta]MDP4485807.1 sugar porter family MFS transporter [Pseudoalteromonas elyakovii]|tara:strand:+ start:56008 stop:57318 length:1311 start_codon:yes stop_codon:yes gene_type:complete
MNKIIYWSITVAVAGFLFGFDTAVISGADKPIQAMWDTSSLFHGLFIMSSALWGTLIGALGGNYPCDKYGRKPTLVLVGVLFLVSAIGSAIAQDPYTFALLRFIGGVGVGISSIVVPAYISEIAPAKYRGRLVALYQFQIVFGILIAFISNFLISGTSGNDWRLMLAVEAIPAVIYLLMVVRAPESPRWLVQNKNAIKKARSILIQLGESKPDTVLLAIEKDKKQNVESKLFSGTYSKAALLAFLFAAFNQLSGINFIIYYAPRLFELAGLDVNQALLSGAGIGLVNLCFTMLGLLLIDKYGRRSLMYVGSIGYIISLAVVAWAFSNQTGGVLVVAFVFVFIAAHAIGQGTVIWVFIAEIFPNKIRSKGQSLGSGTHWLFAAAITLFMPYFLEKFSPAEIFGFFTLMMVGQLIFVARFMPETKGRSLENISINTNN